MSKKSGLSSNPLVSKSHFSFNATRELKTSSHSRLILRIMSGSSLLASDVETGKSDPVCFAWYGPSDSIPTAQKIIQPGHVRTLPTSICPTTTDPIWNEELVFPIDFSTLSLADLLTFCCYIYVADYDPPVDSGGEATYESLGQITIPFVDLIDKGRMMNNSSSLAASSYTLEKTATMRRVDGTIKMAVSLVFGEDVSFLFPQISPHISISTTKEFMLTLVKLRKGEPLAPAPRGNTSGIPSLLPRVAMKASSTSKSSSLASFSDRPRTAPYLFTKRLDDIEEEKRALPRKNPSAEVEVQLQANLSFDDIVANLNGYLFTGGDESLPPPSADSTLDNVLYLPEDTFTGTGRNEREDAFVDDEYAKEAPPPEYIPSSLPSYSSRPMQTLPEGDTHLLIQCLHEQKSALQQDLCEITA